MDKSKVWGISPSGRNDMPEQLHFFNTYSLEYAPDAVEITLTGATF
jgi:hypothetical protein